MYTESTLKSEWLTTMRDMLDYCVKSNIWLNQGQNIDKTWLKCTLLQRLKDQFIQKWHSEINESNKCILYRTYKNGI